MTILVRRSSGLLLRDDFSTDTEVNYASFGCNDWTIGSGSAVLVATYDGALYTSDIATAKCATARWKTSITTGYAYAIVVGGSGCNSEPNGYSLNPSSSTVVRISENDASPSQIDAETFSKAADTWYYARAYIHEGTAYGKFGATDLSTVALSGTAASFTQGQLAFGAYNGTNTWDFVEARTSHLITVNGLPTGWYAKVSDGTTTAKAQESSGTASVDAGLVLFPLTRLSIYDGDPDSGGVEQAYLTSTELADMGGGDVFDYTVPSSGKPLHLYRHHSIPSLGGPYG